MKDRIICAANRNRVTGMIICGVRHWDDLMLPVAENLEEAHRGKCDVWEQGFVNIKREFLTREEAWVVAREAGQIIYNLRNYGAKYGEDGYIAHEGGLFSEHLYQ